MELNLQNLILPKEKTYFRIVLILAVVLWGLVAVTMVGLVIVLVIAFFSWLANGLFVANLKADCVLVGGDQLPDLYETYKSVCKKLELNQIPELYVAQSGGFLNAFTTRHAGRNFVVVYSDILESYGQKSDEIRFLLGHEIGHIKQKHILKQILLAPGLFFPLLGPAYSRACETTCDRYGAYVTDKVEGAVRAMMILAGGKNIGKDMDPLVFSRQSSTHRGFFVSWYELISGYPTSSQRVSRLLAVKEDQSLPPWPRHPLAYFFALFSFGGSSSGGGNLLITVMVIAFLAAIAIPNLLRAQIGANDAMAQSKLMALAQAAESYAKKHAGVYPKSAADLLNENPPDLAEDFCGKTLQGFSYNCVWEENNYEFTAAPLSKGASGSETWVLNKEEYSKSQ